MCKTLPQQCVKCHRNLDIYIPFLGFYGNAVFERQISANNIIYNFGQLNTNFLPYKWIRPKSLDNRVCPRYLRKQGKGRGHGVYQTARMPISGGVPQGWRPF
jgi:hypothetical protein